MKRMFTLASLLLLLIPAIHAQNVALRQKHYRLGNGIAIDGYDPVAYFNAGKPARGDKQFAVNHQGIIYYFATAANRDEFKKSPAKYEPQYGGWCAYAMGSKGKKVDIDPETFKIVNGKLYLFYNKLFNNTLTSWNKDETNLKQNADKNWPGIFQ